VGLEALQAQLSLVAGLGLALLLLLGVSIVVLGVAVVRLGAQLASAAQQEEEPCPVQADRGEYDR
jgi:hypothetical protein